MLTRFICFLIVFIVSVPFIAADSIHHVDGDIVGAMSHYTVTKEDNLYEIARRFDIGIVELLAANPDVDPWTPKEGTELKITTAHILPTIRQGIVLNLSELRLFYFMDANTVMTFPIGIGREGWQTPLGSTTIKKKRKNPAWIPPESIRKEEPNLPKIIPAGPNNPMGAYALNLGWPSYAIHGTNRPYGVGKRSSHGCVRLYPEDIEALFNKVEVGTPVTVIDAPYVLGWQNNILFLEVTPTQSQSDSIAEYHTPTPTDGSQIYDAVHKMSAIAKVDWRAVDAAIAKHSGIPTAIGKKSSGYLFWP